MAALSPGASQAAHLTEEERTTLQHFVSVRRHTPGLTIAPPSARANHQSSITNHQSPIINHQSSITNHQSPIINHQSSITNHQSSITNHQSSIINHQSPIINHQSPIISCSGCAAAATSDSVPARPAAHATRYAHVRGGPRVEWQLGEIAICDQYPYSAKMYLNSPRPPPPPATSPRLIPVVEKRPRC
jgi:hypothetical protein